MSGEIHFSQASGIATLSLSNPDKLNAVDADMWRALQARMSALNADPEVRCVILRGAELVVLRASRWIQGVSVG